MNDVTDVVPAESMVNRANRWSTGRILDRLFIIAYLTATAVATIGWVAAFGWIIVSVAKWLLA